MQAFFSYFGSKVRAAKRYPVPKHELIIEPFAGAAGYSTLHYKHKVLLVDLYPVIADLWRYLISAHPDEIRALPMIAPRQKVAELGLPPAQSSLIGFWLGQAAPRPMTIAKKGPLIDDRYGVRTWNRWTPRRREQIATQVPLIKHWEVLNCSYSELGNERATWFVDPPYQHGGSIYKHGTRTIDYEHLADWCRSREGQVLVCENEPASWLPFEPFYEHHGVDNKVKTELLFQQG